MSSEALAARTCAAWLALSDDDDGEEIQRRAASEVVYAQTATVLPKGKATYILNRYPVRPLEPVCKTALIEAIDLQPKLALQLWCIRESQSAPSKSVADLLQYFAGRAPRLVGLTVEEYRKSIPPALASNVPEERRGWFDSNRELVVVLNTKGLPALQQAGDGILLRLITNQWVTAADLKQ